MSIIHGYHLQNVDRFNKMLVSALVAPSNSTILVLHSEGKPSDDAIKHFLFDVSDLYMKVCNF
jgi:Sedlin, N-terminal conserved region